MLQDRSNPAWGLGANLLAPLFQGGALRAQVDIRTAEQHQAVAAYATAGLRAFNEVEGALSAEYALRDRALLLDATVRDNARALELTQIQFRVGSVDVSAVQQRQLTLVLRSHVALARAERAARATREPPSRARRQLRDAAPASAGRERIPRLVIGAAGRAHSAVGTAPPHRPLPARSSSMKRSRASLSASRGYAFWVTNSDPSVACWRAIGTTSAQWSALT